MSDMDLLLSWIGGRALDRSLEIGEAGGFANDHDKGHFKGYMAALDDVSKVAAQMTDEEDTDDG